MLHQKIREQSLVLSGIQVHDPQATGYPVPRAAGAYEVIQLLAIRRDGREKPPAFRTHLTVAARIVDPHSALTDAD